MAGLWQFPHLHFTIAAKLITSDVVIWPARGSVTFDYYADDTVKTEHYWADAASTLQTLKIDYTYNGDGLVLTETWTAFQPDGVTVALMLTYTYTYNAGPIPAEGTVQKITVS